MGSLSLLHILILLAIAVSGAPFMGLLGTVWGVMITFADDNRVSQIQRNRFFTKLS